MPKSNQSVFACCTGRGMHIRMQLARAAFWLFERLDPPMLCTECGRRDCTYPMPFVRCLNCDESYTGMTPRVWKRLDELKGPSDAEE